MLPAGMHPGYNTAELLLLYLFVIFVAARTVGGLFERLGLPAVPGEILAGVALGPYALSVIPSNDTLHSIAEMGAIFVLFSAGLETSPHELIQVSKRALVVSVAGVIAPFILGFTYLKLRGDATVEATFVAAAMVATSVGITAQVLADMRVLATRTAKIILAAAVFDDILGMVVLAVVAGSASSGGVHWLHLGVLTAEAVAFALFMMFVAPNLVRQLHPRLAKFSRQNTSFTAALAICLFFSWLAVKIGMAAIVGAFFAGLMFADYAPQWNLIPRVGGITAFLAPFFFFDIGARFDAHLLKSNVIRTAVVISVLAVISKVIGCGLPLLREGWSTVFQVGVGMTPRGEVTLIIALVGLQSAILSNAAYGVLVIMTVATTLFAPPILRYLFRDEVREAALENAATPGQL